MTCKERFIADHPDLDKDDIQYILDEECPADHYDNVDLPRDNDGVLLCGRKSCDCWDQEYPEPTAEEKEIPPENNEISCNTCIHEKVCKFRDEFMEAMKLLKNVPDGFEIIIRCKHSL